MKLIGNIFIVIIKANDKSKIICKIKMLCSEITGKINII